MSHVENDLKKFLNLFEELKVALDCDISWASKRTLIEKYSSSLWVAFAYERPNNYSPYYKGMNDFNFVDLWLEATELAAKDVRTILDKLENGTNSNKESCVQSFICRNKTSFWQPISLKDGQVVKLVTLDKCL